MVYVTPLTLSSSSSSCFLFALLFLLEVSEVGPAPDRRGARPLHLLLGALAALLC